MNQHTAPSLHQRAPTPPHRFLKRATQYLLNHKMTHCSTYTTPDLPPTLAARLALCKGIHSNKYRPLKSSQTTPNIQLRLLPNHSPYSKTHRFFSHTSHYITPIKLTPTRQSIHNAAAAKSNPVLYTQLRLMLNLCPLPVW